MEIKDINLANDLIKLSIFEHFEPRGGIPTLKIIRNIWIVNLIIGSLTKPMDQLPSLAWITKKTVNELLR